MYASESNSSYNIVDYECGINYKVLNKSEDFKDQINEDNTIYEIRDIYDLHGETVVIPNECVLKFVGGRIENGTIIGNNTIIDAPDVRIFFYDRTKHSIKGTWKIDAWKADWFGAINDGVAVVNTSTLETTFQGTDNFNAIQMALDCAYMTNCRKVLLREGGYRISRGLNMGWGNQVMMTLESNRLYQDGGWVSSKPNGLVAAQILYDGSEYAININGGYGTTIRGVSVIGKSASINRKNEEGIHLVENVIDKNTNTVDLSHYVSPEVHNNGKAFSQYSPYAGIVTDAYCGSYDKTTGYSTPIFPAGNIGFDSPIVYSVRVNLEYVSVHGFVVGYGISLGKNDKMNEYFKTNNCFFISNVYAVAICTRNGRNTVFRDCLFDGNYCGITNTKFGSVQGSSSPGIGYLYFDNCSFDHSYEVTEYNTEGGPCLFKNCYAEYLFTIGKTSVMGKKPGELKFEDCSFIIKSDPIRGSGIPSTCFWGAAEFIRTDIKDYTTETEQTPPNYLIPMRFGGSLQQCSFYCSSRSSGLYSMVSPLVLLSGAKVSFIGEELPFSSVYAVGNLENKPFYNRRSFSALSCENYTDMFCPYLLRTNAKNSFYNHSFNDKTGELTIKYNGYSYPHRICVGDLIESYTAAKNCTDKTLFVIVSINSTELAEVAIKVIPVTGYRISNGKYELFEKQIENQKIGGERGYWYVYNTRFQELIRPMVADSNRDNSLKVKRIPSSISIGDELYIKEDASLMMDSPVVIDINKEQNLINVLGNISGGVGEVNWLIKSYSKSRFWYDFNDKGEELKGNKIHQLISQSYAAVLTINISDKAKYVIIDNLGTSYGMIEGENSSVEIELPMNSYKIINCNTENIVEYVNLDNDKTISI